MLSGTLAAAAVVALLAAPALAQSSSPFSGFKHDGKAPIEIASDSLAVNQSEGQATFTGDVVAGQGELRLTSEVLHVWYASGGEGGGGDIERLRAEGDVTLASREETARGAWAEYDVPGGTITMGGGVTLTRDGNAIRGERLTVDLEAGTGRMEGGRVRSVFQPSPGSQ